jgi:ABC-2 type transport system permease protein
MAELATAGSAYAALVGRNVKRLLRLPPVVIGTIVFPLLFFGLFWAVLGNPMRLVGLDPGQYLPPAIVVQASFLAAMSTTFFLADDLASGILGRHVTQPLPRLLPYAARVTADLTRAGASLVAVTAVAVIAGFRIESGLLGLLGYAGIVAGFAVVVILGCGLVGLTARNPESALAIVEVPYLPVIMLSSAFIPTEYFPDWMEPIVERSPVTLTVDALRSVAGGGPGPEPLWWAWVLGLSVCFASIGYHIVRRPQFGRC